MPHYRVLITVELQANGDADAACEAVRLARGIVEDHFEISNAAIDVWSTNLDQPVVGSHWCWSQYRPGEPAGPELRNRLSGEH